MFTEKKNPFNKFSRSGHPVVTLAAVAVLAVTHAGYANGATKNSEEAKEPRLQKTVGDEDAGTLKRDTVILKVPAKAEKPNQNGRYKDPGQVISLERRAEKIKKIRADVTKIK